MKSYLTNIFSPLQKASDCHFDQREKRMFGKAKSPENKALAQGISPPSSFEMTTLRFSFCHATMFVRHWKMLGLRMTKITILFLVILASLQTAATAQNTLQINNAEGIVDDTMGVSLSIHNSESFISFQCDVLLPAGFQYISGSIALTPRSVDHVVNVTNMGNNTLRILSYSLNNTPFLQDSGAVARLMLITPAESGLYSIGLNNGIIGNAESVNILDSLVAGEISLNPIGLLESKVLKSDIQCFPNPFTQYVNIRLDMKNSQPVQVHVFNINGTMVNNFELTLDQPGITDFVFNSHQLLGKDPSSGTYVISFGLSDENQKYTLVKKIHFQP